MNILRYSLVESGGASDHAPVFAPDSAREDFFGFFRLCSQAELFFLAQRIFAGRIDGYHTAPVDGMLSKTGCCLIGWLAFFRQQTYVTLKSAAPVRDLVVFNAVEKFILDIRAGQTPENCNELRLILDWMNEFLARPVLAETSI